MSSIAVSIGDLRKADLALAAIVISLTTTVQASNDRILKLVGELKNLPPDQGAEQAAQIEEEVKAVNTITSTIATNVAALQAAVNAGEPVPAVQPQLVQEPVAVPAAEPASIDTTAMADQAAQRTE